MQMQELKIYLARELQVRVSVYKSWLKVQRTTAHGTRHSFRLRPDDLEIFGHISQWSS